MNRCDSTGHEWQVREDSPSGSIEKVCLHCDQYRCDMVKIKAVLIDVYSKSISDIEIEPTLSEFYRVIKCRMVQSVHMQWLDDDLLVDEEGLLKPEITDFFTLGDATYVGNGLIVGHPDEDGGETSATVKAADVAKHVRIFNVKTYQNGVSI